MSNLKNIIALSLLASSWIACEKVFVDPPANHPEAIFENLWTTLNEDYAPFEERGVNWQAQYNTFRPMVDASTSDDELFNILSLMLEPLDDGHVNLTAPGKDVFNANKIRRELIDDELFSIPVVKTYLTSGFEEGEENSYIYGQIKNENVAYIYFDYVADNFFKLNDFLNAFPNVNGYIIDMRHNQGGDFTYCFSEIGQLVDQRRYVFQSKTKNGPGADDFDEWHQWEILPEGDYINKPIVVLTDRYTISAGERAVMAFGTLPNVMIMGDTTSGAHGTSIGRELANGWFYSLVPQKVELSDGQSYEGIGLAPDVYSKNTSTDIEAGIDQTLQNAIDLLK